jgi:hypothetical protein
MDGLLRRLRTRVNGRNGAAQPRGGAYEKIVKAATNILARLYAFEEVKT